MCIIMRKLIITCLGKADTNFGEAEITMCGSSPLKWHGRIYKEYERLKHQRRGGMNHRIRSWIKSGNNRQKKGPTYGTGVESDYCPWLAHAPAERHLQSISLHVLSRFI